MDIILANERAFQFVPQTTLEVAIDRVEQKKIQLVSGTLGALLSRPKAEDIQLVSVENRLEACWEISVFLRTVYERNQSFTVPVSGKEVRQVTILGQDLDVAAGAKGNPTFSFNGVEHCLEEYRHNFTFDGVGSEVDHSKYKGFAKSEILELGQFSPDGVLVVPPKASASTVVRSIMAKVIKPVQAQVIHEEKLNIETLDINFRPVYALEYLWAAKSKHVVIEFDALTGEIQGNGKKMADQVKGMLNRDLLFDVTADAVGMIVPGGSIAVKLVKAAMDHKK